MNRLTTTPFGQRPVTACLMETIEHIHDAAPVGHVDKWEVFRALCTARLAFGVTDRDLTVLNALLTFHPGAVLGDNGSLIVFPSNRSLSTRAHGMTESTLRRHLAALAQAGLILRHDSPNGKRYAAKDRDGQIVRAFGFDLRPLLVRSAEITQAAQATQDAAKALKRLREDLTLKKRDALKLATYGADEGLPGDWDTVLAQLLDVHKMSRRKLGSDDLRALLETVENLLDVIRGMFSKTENMHGNDTHSERQFHNSKTEGFESEPCLDSNRAQVDNPAPQDEDRTVDLPNLPIQLVVKACPEIEPYVPGGIRHWHELIGAAGMVRAMMGISSAAWAEACEDMGAETAAIAVACMLERFDQIKSPGGYLRALSRKAADGRFSAGPMVMALLNKEDA